MKEALGKLIEQDYQKVLNLFKIQNISIEDDYVLNLDLGFEIDSNPEHYNRDAVLLFFTPILLPIPEPKNEITFWWKVQFFVPISNGKQNRDLSTYSQAFRDPVLTKVLDHLMGIKLSNGRTIKDMAFMDEDAFGTEKNYGRFCRPEISDDNWSLAFFINPDYPNGHWENHSLD